MARVEGAKPFIAAVSLLFFVAQFAACSPSLKRGTTSPTATPCDFTLSIEQNWSCPSSRQETITGLIVQSHFKLLTISSRKKRVYKVIEPTRHIRGTVNYDTARMVGDNRGTYVVVPFADERGRKYILVWAVNGEFDKYRGIYRDVPNRVQG